MKQRLTTASTRTGNSAALRCQPVMLTVSFIMNSIIKIIFLNLIIMIYSISYSSEGIISANQYNEFQMLCDNRKQKLWRCSPEENIYFEKAKKIFKKGMYLDNYEYLIKQPYRVPGSMGLIKKYKSKDNPIAICISGGTDGIISCDIVLVINKANCQIIDLLLKKWGR